MRMLKTSAQSQEYAEHVPDTAGVYIVPAFAGMGAPYWDQYARGTDVYKRQVENVADTGVNIVATRSFRG